MSEMLPSKRKPGPPKGDPRLVEAGRHGGLTVARERGRAFYQAIGRKGGLATRDRYGPGFFSSIGRKGGQHVKEARRGAFYASIGRRGGTGPTKGCA